MADRPTDPDIRSEGVAVVIRGALNPAIISPGWLFANELVTEREHRDSKPEAIVPNLAVFEVAGIRFQVTTDTLSVSTQTQRDFERVRDVVVGVLTVLHHTPVNMLGINHHYHLALPTADAWHKVGDRLASKQPWEPVLFLPGMQDVTISSVRTDNYAGNVVVSVQPSQAISQGVFVAQNDHFILKAVDRQPVSRNEFNDPDLIAASQPPTPSSTLILVAKDILLREWYASAERARNILDAVWRLGVQ